MTTTTTWGRLVEALQDSASAIDAEAAGRALTLLRTRPAEGVVDLHQVGVESLAVIYARRAKRAPSDRTVVALAAGLADLEDESVLAASLQQDGMIVSLWLRVGTMELVGFHVGADKRGAGAGG